MPTPSLRAVPLLGVASAAAVLVGVLAVHALPALPPRVLDAVIVVVGCALLAWPRGRIVALALLGFAWCALRADAALDARLPRGLEGRDFLVSGVVQGLPLRRDDATRFALRIDRVELDGTEIPLHGTLRLSWYEDAPDDLDACSRWQLRLRLKRPRGLINPGGYDSERQALERGVVAVGYVRDDAANQRVGARTFCVDALRERLSRGIAERVPDTHDAALLQAFSIGDTRGLDADDWEIARINGIPHLIAISGFHVGVAGAFGAAFAWLLWTLWPRLGLRIAFPQAQAVSTLIAATLYGILAGGSLPTVRTLLMIAVFALTRLARRNAGGAHTLALALLAVLAFDPLATLAPGFWLSFVGVAFLMLSLERGRGAWRFLRELSVGQCVMTVSLLPLGVWFFGEASLVGAFSNLIAVPLVSFVIVPLCLVGTLALLAAPSLAAAPFAVAAWISHWQWRLLEWAATWPAAHGYLPEPAPWALALALLGALWLFLPRGVPMRALGLLLFAPLLWPNLHAPDNGAFAATVVDVGQGLSVIVRTHSHVLVYDTGARYPSGFDLGDAAVLPTLHALGVSRLDALVVSHADNDHAGGAAAVVRAHAPARTLAGEPERIDVPAETCAAGQAWTWDEVEFRVLSPVRNGDIESAHGNDLSCVVLVSGRGGRLLLTGDISSNIEPAVAQAVGMGAPLALVVPHHGSRTSSGETFLDALAPTLAVVSTGWRNHFHHPDPRIVARYAAAHIPLEDTALDGAVTLDFPVDEPPRLVARERERRRRYWRE